MIKKQVRPPAKAQDVMSILDVIIQIIAVLTALFELFGIDFGGGN